MQPPSQGPISDSDIGPDGSEPLLIKKTKPNAPRGYIARYSEGRWLIVPDPAVYGKSHPLTGDIETQASMWGGGSGGESMTESTKSLKG